MHPLSLSKIYFCQRAKIVTKTDHQRAILDEVQARKEEILELEHNIQVGNTLLIFFREFNWWGCSFSLCILQELNGMFLDMMILIDEQVQLYIINE